ncbi:glycosyltransferase family 2 protein [Flavobacterium ovatum]|uniref:glycosyltransferase family 2 protein n=1 Tax=Flavobacterium ovatum TaxID=1928857 RepID=UPI00344E7FBA
MNPSPFISVVMPVYNCALYIEEAVNSILNQTFTDFELIIIDDASTDGTTDILKKYTDPRIITLYKTLNQGVSSATNEGFRLANGKYIARMDADDIAVKERFEKQVRILEQNKKILVCSSWVQHFGKSSSLIKFKETHEEILSELLIQCSICMPASMFRREELEGYFYEENKHSGEDYDFWTKIAWKGEFYNIQEALLLYRVHDTQASKIYKPQQIVDDIQIQLSLLKKLAYDKDKYPDTLITKMRLLNATLSIEDLVLFLEWIKELISLNDKTRIFPHKEFKAVLKRIRRSLIYSLYFKQTGITKEWRAKALLLLPLNELLFVLTTKGREIRKRLLRK